MAILLSVMLKNTPKRLRGIDIGPSITDAYAHEFLAKQCDKKYCIVMFPAPLHPLNRITLTALLRSTAEPRAHPANFDRGQPGDEKNYTMNSSPRFGSTEFESDNDPAAKPANPTAITKRHVEFGDRNANRCGGLTDTSWPHMQLSVVRELVLPKGRTRLQSPHYCGHLGR